MCPYEIVYSDRRTLGITVTRDGKVIVRAPRKTPYSLIEKTVSEHEGWIRKHVMKMLEKQENEKELGEDEIKELRKAAKIYFFEKTQLFANIMNLKYGRITITGAKTRFGSCSSKGNISFSYLLMTYPEAAREYVIVHELSHLVYMNHSKRFYDLIEKYMPDYKERRKLLK